MYKILRAEYEMCGMWKRIDMRLWTVGTFDITALPSSLPILHLMPGASFCRSRHRFVMFSRFLCQSQYCRLICLPCNVHEKLLQLLRRPQAHQNIKNDK